MVIGERWWKKRNKSVEDLKGVGRVLISAAVKNYEWIDFRAEVRVLRKLGGK